MILGEISAAKAAKLCLGPKAQSPHFAARARSLLARTDSFKLQAFNERLKSNMPHVTLETENRVVGEYLAGVSQAALVKKYHMWCVTLHKILEKHKIPIRGDSEALSLHFHGRIPNVVPSLTREKLYVAFAMLGDNASRNHAPKEHNYKVGLSAGGNREFAEVWCDNFERAFGLRPKINERNPKSLIAGIGCKQAWLDLHKYFSFGTYDWDIKDSVMDFLLNEAPISSVGYALQAFTEAEGHPNFSNHGWDRRIFIRSVNVKGLQKILKLFAKLNICSKIYFGKNAPVLIISRKRNIQGYMELVGFTSKRKQTTLEKMVNSYACYSTVTDFASDLGKSGSCPLPTAI
ncbi:MAG: hypothetical protein ABH852_00235 [Methanobacteriota archaeon]